MELAEVARRDEADEQHAQAEREDVGCRARIESAHAREEQISNDRVAEAPKNVDRGRGEPFAGRFGEGTLEGASHRAGDKMRSCVCRKNATKEVRHKPKPVHNAVFLSSRSLSRRETISCAGPVSPTRGKTFRMLYWCASSRTSVMASIARVTLNPRSQAWRAVASTPPEVTTPVTTTWVTPRALSR